MARVRSVLGIIVSCLLIGCTSAPCEPRHPGLSAPGWRWDDERATAAWCAQNQTGPRYRAVLTEDEGWLLRQLPFDVSDDGGLADALVETDLDDVTAGPLRISIRDAHGERFAWNGWEYSVWHVVDHRLFYVEYRGGTPGGRTVAVDLDTGRVLWKVPSAYPMPGGWSLWMNRKMLQVRHDGVYVWSIDGGTRSLEILNRDDGRVGDWRYFLDR